MISSRREFLVAGGLTSLAITSRALGLQRTASKRVLVVGAGPAGLSAAYELTRAGHDVTVLEARSRPGGRMYTLRDGFADGLYVEAGALYLSSNNPGLEYARDFGLEAAPLPFRRDLGSVAYLEGKRIVQRPGEPVPWPVELPQDDRGLSVGQLQNKYHRGPLRQAMDPGRLNGVDFPRDEAFAELDATSLFDYWRRNGASDEAIRLMRLRYFDGYGDGIESVSLLQLARESASFQGATGAFRVVGGNDRICTALAERLRGRMRYGSPVSAIRQTESGVEIVVRSEGTRARLPADFAVVTPPPQVLRDIDFAPRLSPAKAEAIRSLAGTDVTRVFLQTRSRFWEADQLDGSALTELPIGAVYDAAAALDTERGVLESFTYGSRARRMAALDESERARAAREGIELAYPALSGQVESTTSYSWGDDPWARGGHSAFAPGQVRTLLPALQAPEGRVYFAGDTVGGVPGYSHAAFASGRRAAKEIAERIAASA